MREITACLSLVALVLAAGCGGGGVESDMERSGDELRAIAAKMSDADLRKKMDELEEFGAELNEEFGKGDPSRELIERKSKLMEVNGIYGAELMRRGMK